MQKRRIFDLPHLKQSKSTVLAHLQRPPLVHVNRPPSEGEGTIVSFTSTR